MATRGASSATRAIHERRQPAAQSPWQTATITRIEKRTPRVTSFFFQPSRPFAYHAGQHVDVRLTAPDGYQARALLLHRLGAGERRDDRAGDREARRRRGLALLPRGRSGRRRDRVARSARRPFRLVRQRRRAAAAGRRRVRRGAADGDGAPPRGAQDRRCRWRWCFRRGSGTR